jgi:hypothetical protein
LKIADPDPRASGGRWTLLMPYRRASDRSRFGLGSMTSSSPRSGRQAEDEEVEATLLPCSQKNRRGFDHGRLAKHFCRVSQILLESDNCAVRNRKNSNGITRPDGYAICTFLLIIPCLELELSHVVTRPLPTLVDRAGGRFVP